MTRLTMNISQQILFLVGTLGAVNGLVVSIYLFLSKKMKSPAALFLAIFLLAISIRVGKSAFLYFNPKLAKIYLQIGLSACWLIGPSLFYFYKSAVGGVRTIPVSWKWAYGILTGIIVLTGVIWPYSLYTFAWKAIIAPLIYLEWCIYLVATGVLLKTVWRKAFSAGTQLQPAEKFWVLLFLSNCIIHLAYLLSYAAVIHGMYIVGAVSFSFFLYLTFFFLYNSNLQSIYLDAPMGTGEKPAKRKIPLPDASNWIDKLERVIHDEQLYKDPQLKLSDLAKKIQISSHQLSQLLNDNLGKSFSTYINEYRIKEACQLITTDDRLTLEAIGYEVGFNSKSTFYTAFKKIKDTTPALYKEHLKIRNNI